MINRIPLYEEFYIGPFPRDASRRQVTKEEFLQQVAKINDPLRREADRKILQQQ